ncbi:MAG: hypothetical protein A2015_16505 [Spirochaetes bacterium GWF1_31_7]|nr:MAG: hypothetical protein A2Y30_13870 [Spirochaetes bacterium GWE1_32_154]OHD50046.1 MAG: hypothetical protein A2Y29_11915 [Spirochaetes bacterium GWE2_31_10]OHD52360.1 MAG: hypothetical protein A2015_16505 [Spirochaetes bacterium GWF1_31_7]OHD83156.1 MAG: hypothetical protein A2355_09960 [Spirochaetes bacterium RIFOXYB1_FULL_32_8]HBD96000.1 hypothetical protein [Spirochaetia bacterium]
MKLIRLKLLIVFIFVTLLSFPEAISDDLSKAEIVIKEILTNPEYTYKENQEQIKPVFTMPRFIEKIIDLISKPFAVFLIIFICVSSIIIGIFFIRLIKFNTKKYPLDTQKINTTNNPQNLLEKAFNLLNSGFLKESITLLISALLLFYSKNGIIQYKDGITNREYIDSITLENEKTFFTDIVHKAERIVFSMNEIKRSECIIIYDTISKRIC